MKHYKAFFFHEAFSAIPAWNKMPHLLQNLVTYYLSKHFYLFYVYFIFLLNTHTHTLDGKNFL